MTPEYTQAIHSYAKDITLLSHSNYTEHTFRGSLQTLLNNLLPQYTPINEPQRTACGAPDYALIDHNQQPHAYIEAKDLFDKDLRGLKEHKQQFDRYKQALPRVCFTDYLEFHFYNNGEATEVVTLLREKAKGGFEIADAERFVSILKEWADCPIQPITTARRLAELMASKARLLTDAIIRTMSTDAYTEMTGQYNAFRENLIRDLSIEQFADLYSQTIVYGMFAAKIHDNATGDFTREKAARLIPVSNPFLRKIFYFVANNDLDDSVAWIVDDLADAFNATQMDKVLGKYAENDLHDDPLTHFYEDFLSAYDPKLRKCRGVYYTPQPVVSFIVRTIDEVLRTHFGLTDGLADRSTIERGGQTYHRVQILDPATGTGTFLAETVRHIRSRFQGNEGLWKAYVDAHLRPRLNGFEIMMAPYTITHLKLDMMMQTENKAKDRLRVYLTNSLEAEGNPNGNLLAQWLVEEINEAAKVKRDLPIMVMMGNPPYAVSSANKGQWIAQKIETYKANLIEKKLNLDDDYIKFIRLAHDYIDRNGAGVFGYITNNSYLDGITHRRMRESLMSSFSHIYIANLHGNARKKETAPDGTKDENVFDIMAGVSIAIFVKSAQNPAHHVETGHAPSLQQGKVYYLDLYGLRREKYAALDSLSIATAEWQTLSPSAPNYFFVPKDFSLLEEYERGIKIDELFGVSNSGIKTDRDALFVDMDKGELANRIKKLLSDDFDEGFKERYNVKDSSSYKLTSLIKANKYDDKYICEEAYRPFDRQYIYYDPKIISRPADKVMRHMLNGDNVGLLFSRQANNDWRHIFVVNGLTDICSISSQTKEGTYVFPLYVYDANGERKLNMREEILEKCLSGVVETGHAPSLPDAESFFAYIYAILHSPSYRTKYKEFLKIDFPRIPVPKDGEEFMRLVRLGKELIDLHLMREGVETGHASSLPTFPIEGTNIVDTIKFNQNRVYINSSQYFEGVPAEAWDFYIGGYQPAQKWLKDRKGRTLNYDEIEHYRRVIAVLKRTGEVMEEIG